MVIRHSRYMYVPQFYLEAKPSFLFQNLVDFPLSVKSAKQVINGFSQT